MGMKNVCYSVGKDLELLSNREINWRIKSRFSLTHYIFPGFQVNREQ